MQCQAKTRRGQRCTVEARLSGLCHVHDPAVQCGYVNVRGKRCTTPTGGGRCGQHRQDGDLDAEGSLFEAPKPRGFDPYFGPPDQS